jgi:hypothetical protein
LRAAQSGVGTKCYSFFLSSVYFGLFHFSTAKTNLLDFELKEIFVCFDVQRWKNAQKRTKVKARRPVIDGTVPFALREVQRSAGWQK